LNARPDERPKGGARCGLGTTEHAPLASASVAASRTPRRRSCLRHPSAVRRCLSGRRRRRPRSRLATRPSVGLDSTHGTHRVPHGRAPSFCPIGLCSRTLATPSRLQRQHHRGSEQHIAVLHLGLQPHWFGAAEAPRRFIHRAGPTATTEWPTALLRSYLRGSSQASPGHLRHYLGEVMGTWTRTSLVICEGISRDSDSGLTSGLRP
jgi:hypothetical protein